jgi:hypothetical protein
MRIFGCITRFTRRRNANMDRFGKPIAREMNHTVFTNLCAHPEFLVFASFSSFKRSWHASFTRLAMGT